MVSHQRYTCTYFVHSTGLSVFDVLVVVELGRIRVVVVDVVHIASHLVIGVSDKKYTSPQRLHEE